MRQSSVTRMATIEVSIEGELCGPISMGTAAVTRALMDHLELPVGEAVAIVDRCVFEGERVTLVSPSRARADALLAAWSALPAAPRIHARVSE